MLPDLPSLKCVIQLKQQLQHSVWAGIHTEDSVKQERERQLCCTQTSLPGPTFHQNFYYFKHPASSRRCGLVPSGRGRFFFKFTTLKIQANDRLNNGFSQKKKYPRQCLQKANTLYRHLWWAPGKVSFVRSSERREITVLPQTMWAFK